MKQKIEHPRIIREWSRNGRSVRISETTGGYRVEINVIPSLEKWDEVGQIEARGPFGEQWKPDGHLSPSVMDLLIGGLLVPWSGSEEVNNGTKYSH